MKNNVMIGSIIAIVILILDQWSKFAAFSFLDGLGQESYNVLPFFNIVRVYNTGVSFGMLQGIAYGHIILSLFASAVTIALFIWLIMADNLRLVIGLGLVIGGAIGNIFDRVTIGAVKDFLDFYIGNWHWPAFNIADSAILIGVIILLIDSFLENKKEAKQVK